MAPKAPNKLSIDTNNDALESSQGRDSDLADRLREAMKDLGFSAATLAARSGVTEATIKGNMQGKVPNAKSLFLIARTLNVHPEWLALGFGEKSNYSRGLRYVPKYDARLSAGPGSWLERGEIVSAVVFNGEFLARFGSELSDDFIVLDVVGDSMEPTVRDGAEVLISVKHQPWSDGIWAFAIGNSLRLKRLRRGLKSLLVISDNPAYPPEEITADDEDQLHLIGRALWGGQAL